MSFQTPDYIRAVLAERERELRNIQLAGEARRARCEERVIERRNRSVRRTHSPLGALVYRSRKTAIE